MHVFTNQINPISLGSWCIKGTEESTLKMDSSVPLTHHDPSDLGLIFLTKKHKIRFWILSDLGIQSWIFLKKRTLSQHSINTWSWSMVFLVSNNSYACIYRKLMDSQLTVIEMSMKCWSGVNQGVDGVLIEHRLSVDWGFHVIPGFKS